MVTRYQKRISGPLLDRIDIHVEVPRVEYEKLSDDRLASRRRRSVDGWPRPESGSCAASGVLN